MPRLAALALLLLGACTANPTATASADPAPQIPEHGSTPGHICQSKGMEQFVGRAANEATKGAILKATHAAILRWAPPGTMLTMDYRSDRVTVYLGDDRKVTKINCG